MTITLYELTGANPACRFSPYGWRIRMSLRHKGLAFEGIPWRFTEKEVIAPSGGTTVPVIVDQGRWVRDSLPIAEYLEHTYPATAPIFGSPASLGLARLTATWVDRTVHGPLARLILMDIFNVLGPRDQEYFRTSREKRFGATLEQVAEKGANDLPLFRAALEPARHVLARQQFLAGDDPTYADYALYGTLIWARMVSDKTLLEQNDPIQHWLDRADQLHDNEGRKALASGRPGAVGPRTPGS